MTRIIYLDARVDLELDEEQYEQVRLAARAEHKTLTEFCYDALVEQAKQDRESRWSNG